MAAKTWTPCVVRERPKTGTEPVLIRDEDSDYNGDRLYSITTTADDPAAMTAGEWANLGLVLLDGFERLPDYVPPPDDEEL